MVSIKSLLAGFEVVDCYEGPLTIEISYTFNEILTRITIILKSEIHILAYIAIA